MKMYTSLYSFFLSIVLFSVCHGSIIANSVTDFSGQQGQDNWYYGYFTGSSNNFQQMTIYNPSDTLFYQPNFGSPEYGPLWTMPGYYRTSSSGYEGNHWTVVGPSFMHPTDRGLNYFPVRRWISEVDGFIQISGQLCMFDLPNRTSGLDGITGKVFVDDQEVWSGLVNNADIVGTSFQLDQLVHLNSKVDFVVYSNASDTCDHGKFTAEIVSVPEPITLSLLAVGGIAILRKPQI